MWLTSLVLAFSPSLAPQQETPQLLGRGWGPEQATGAPDTPTAGDHPTAWASRGQDTDHEWLEVHYPEPVVPVGLRVFETFHPGAIQRVIALEVSGKEHLAWEGTSPSLGAEGGAVTLLPLAIDFPVSAFRLELDCSTVRGWNEIDAVGLHDEEGLLWWATSATASSTFARGKPGDHARSLPPMEGLKPAWRTRAEGLFALYRDLREDDGDPELIDALARELVAAQTAGAPYPLPSFDGMWDTNFGAMRLLVNGTRVTGTYALGGSSRIEGELDGNRLDFRYTEPQAAGVGHFELSADGKSFEGRWRQDGIDTWRPWTGTRSDDETADATWLVILEAPWEEDLADTPYAFGAMLESIFGHRPGIRVRRRSFTDGKSFEGWARQLAWLEGPVILVVASHATKVGVASRDELIPPERVAAALENLPSLKLVHFSACEAMAGEIPELIVESCGENENFAGVSGYEVSVDWMGSAMCEFLYLELILGRGLKPARAAEQLMRLLAFAGSEAPKGSPVPPRTSASIRPAANAEAARDPGPSSSAVLAPAVGAQVARGNSGRPGSEQEPEPELRAVRLRGPGLPAQLDEA